MTMSCKISMSVEEKSNAKSALNIFYSVDFRKSLRVKSVRGGIFFSVACHCRWYKVNCISCDVAGVWKCFI